MDTLWFAIDKHGHVAILDSGEGGAVPLDGGADETYEGDGYEVATKLVDALGGAPPRSLPEEGVHAQGPYGTFVMRAALDAVAPFASNVQRRPGDDALVVVFAPPPPPGFSLRRLFGGAKDASSPPSFERAHAAGVCNGCRVNDAEDVDLDVETIAERLGLYRFEGPAGIAEPYERVHAPATPLTADRITELAKSFVRFDGSFAEHATLQPFEHWKDVQSWSASWVGTDGKVRCAPGREKDYAKEYPDLAKDYPDVEPPKR